MKRSLLWASMAIFGGVSGAAFAQRPDSTRFPVTAAPADSERVFERKPPISARRAFLSSLVLPGYGQSFLGRKRSGAMMLALEAISIAMVRESALGVREARRNAADSVIVSYVDAAGLPKVTYAPGFPTSLIKTRKEHVEDWMALLIANHLFSAADALVAAVLWDLPAEVAVGGSRRTTNFGLRVRF